MEEWSRDFFFSSLNLLYNVSMSNTIIVYYSLEGNVDFLCRAMAKQNGADLCRLETVKEYPKKGLMKFLHGGRDASFGFKPELKTEVPDLSNYSRVILACPVWAGKMAAPLASYIEASDFTGKEVFAIVSSGGGSAEKCLAQISSSVEAKGSKLKDSVTFVNPIKNAEASLEKIKDFAQKIG